MSEMNDVILVSKSKFYCDGNIAGAEDMVDGHPRVYLQINPSTGLATCPYCDKVYGLEGRIAPKSEDAAE